jgi:hypothetical protein
VIEVKKSISLSEFEKLEKREYIKNNPILMGKKGV